MTTGERTIGSHVSVPEGQSESKEEECKRETHWGRGVELEVAMTEAETEEEEESEVDGEETRGSYRVKESGPTLSIPLRYLMAMI